MTAREFWEPTLYMKIAIMVRGYIPVPTPKDIIYAPIDLAIAMSRGLVKRGHQVDFYAPRGSKLDIPVKSLQLKPLVHNYTDFQGLLNSVDLLTHYMPGMWDEYMAKTMFQRAAAGKYDILHFHHPEAAMSYASLFPTVPIVYTLNDPIFGWYQDMFRLYNTPNQHYISISDNQRKPAPNLNYAGTVYNGIDVKKFPFSAKHGEYLLFVGRIVPEKGIKEAIAVARATGLKLLIIGPTYDDTRSYFHKYIENELNGQITYIGYVDHDKLWPYFQKAKAFLAPIQWEEPFGLTIVEAMATGTPVIGFRRGSIPEVVQHGKTGFVVDTVEQMARAVGKIHTIDRRDCRERVKQHFSIDKMVLGYEAAYKRILAL
jgi:glycosyltransferase involved in cell wall biosynthesis